MHPLLFVLGLSPQLAGMSSRRLFPFLVVASCYLLLFLNKFLQLNLVFERELTL
jgi:hypothetical protein